MTDHKQTYAAVVASSPERNAGESSSTTQQHDAPPPYRGPIDQKTQPPPPQPIGVPQHQYVQQQQQLTNYTAEAWSPPANEHVARSRTNRRFTVAMLWAFGIWLLIGMLLGGGISDVNSTRGHHAGHWNKHGEWREDHH